ncbi:zinc dependent phospholipase C family protein [Rufibacter roseus]|uniref:Zinc dependent phospholipase C family protein n=1 Tax=Rufibacter roseus TaxID=1567108 RepID=A0ABW2DTB6_9BACT|nr:zinc dependent phospholipase C family protein [Rufibacter roseus]
MSTLRKHILIVLLPLLLLTARESAGYGVLTHQAIIDVAWDKSIVPALRQKFPKATEEELLTAYAHAYGGAIIQDMGYFPFGNTFFTDLTHYVRSGDFIEALITESKTLHEYAFALGALAHYYADNYGHPIGTNVAVPMVYPDLKVKHGDTITYEENPAAHVKMEFGFDVLQVARGNYASDAYRNFIGFEVSKEVLERAFLKTYGLELKSIFVSLELAITTFRYSVRNLIPDLTKAAWNLKAKEIQSSQPSMTRRNFHYRLRRAEFHKTWGREYEQPNLFQRILSWLLRILPKIGPSQTLAFKPPTPEAEKVFMESFNETSKRYNAALNRVAQGKQTFENKVLDTGEPSEPDAYTKTDETFAELLEKLAKNEFKHLTKPLKETVLQYYQAMAKPKPTEKEELEEWGKVQENLQKLQQATVTN